MAKSKIDNKYDSILQKALKLGITYIISGSLLGLFWYDVARQDPTGAGMAGALLAFTILGAIILNGFIALILIKENLIGRIIYMILTLLLGIYAIPIIMGVIFRLKGSEW